MTSTKKAQDLTKDDIKKLCAWSDTVMPEPTDKQACTLVSAAFSDDKASCEMSVDQCLKEAQMEGSSGASDDATGQGDAMSQDEEDEPCLDEAQLEDCSATVAEFEACMRAAASQAKKAYESVSCELAGSQMESDTADREDETPAQCKTIEQKCPHINDEDGSDGDGSSGGTYECDDGSSIASDSVCDGSEDCASGEDEAGCSSDGTDGVSDGTDEYVCNDSSSIPSSFVCDGTDDCSGGEDEAGCASDGTSSDPGQFECGDGTTFVPNDWVCDGSEDCPNGQDEVSCSSSSGATGTTNGLRASSFSASKLHGTLGLRASSKLTRLFRAY